MSNRKSLGNIYSRIVNYPANSKQRKKIREDFKSKEIYIGKNVSYDIFSEFDGHNYFYDNVNLNASKVGVGTYIAFNSFMPKTKIGRFCAIGENVRTHLGLHPAKDWVSIHPAFFSEQAQAGFTFTNETLFEEHKYVDDEKKFVVEIGNDVWLANNVMIPDGVKIGDGAILGAGSVVTKNVEPYTIVAGVPAKLIRKRYSEDQIEKLLKIKWWNWDFEKIKENYKYFSDIEKLIKIFG
jgi:acetyltransferase-like isoleucine patch superfamily enzyme